MDSSVRSAMQRRKEKQVRALSETTVHDLKETGNAQPVAQPSPHSHLSHVTRRISNVLTALRKARRSFRLVHKLVVVPHKEAYHFSI
jgi:hypothetical protein